MPVSDGYEMLAQWFESMSAGDSIGADNANEPSLTCRYELLTTVMKSGYLQSLFQRDSGGIGYVIFNNYILGTVSTVNC